MKGQAHSFDFTFAVLAFLLVLGFFMASYSNIVYSYDKDMKRDYMEMQSIRFLENLVRTPGIPENWEDVANISDPISIGLSEWYNNVWDSTKIEAFFDLDYETIKRIWGIRGYDFELKFIGSGKSIGNPPNGSVTDIVFFQRFGHYNSSIEKLEFSIWEK